MILLAAIAALWLLRRLLAPLLAVALIAGALLLASGQYQLSLPSPGSATQQLKHPQHDLSGESLERLLRRLGLPAQVPPRPICGTSGALPQPICQPAPRPPHTRQRS